MNIFSNPLNQLNSFSEVLPPYSLHVDDTIVNLKNDRLMLVIKLEGINFESYSNESIQHHNNTVNRLISDITNQYPDQVQFHGNVIRSKVEVNSHYEYESNFIQKFHDKYIERFNKKPYFETGFYLSIIFKFNEFEQAVLDIKEIATIMISVLKDWKPRLLSLYKRVNGIRAKDITHDEDDTLEETEAKTKYINYVNENGITFSEITEYLHFLVNLEWKPKPVSDGFIAESLPEVELFFGHDIVELRHPDFKKWATCLDLKDFPETTKVGMFDKPLLDQKFEFIVNFSFLGMSRPKALSIVRGKLNQLKSVGDKATFQHDELNAFDGHITSGSVALGIFNSSAVCFGNSPAEAHKNASNLKSLYLKEAATIFNKASLSAPISYFSIFPANSKVARPFPKSSRIFSSIFCMHNYSTGKPFFNPLGDGTALMPLETEAQNIFHFNFHATEIGKNRIGEPDPAHTQILGTTGVGKSVLQIALQAFATRFDCQIFAMDKDRSMDLFIRAIGGDYFLLKDGEPTGFNPFQFEREPSNQLKMFVIKLVSSLVKVNGYLSASDEEKIKLGVETVFKMDFEDRRLAYIIQTIPDDLNDENSLRTRLSKWIANGAFSWVLDNPKNCFDPELFQYVGFDLTTILVEDNLATEPVLSCLFYLKDRLVKKGMKKQIPTFVSVEEYWLPANFDITANSMKNTLKTGRKLLEIMLLITQQPEDALDCPISATIVQQTVTKIFLPNPDAVWESYSKVGLTKKEFDRVRGLDTASRVFLVKQNNQTAFARLNLDGFDDELHIFSAQAKTLSAIDDLLDDPNSARLIHDKKPNEWLPKFFKLVRSESNSNLDISQFEIESR